MPLRARGRSGAAALAGRLMLRIDPLEVLRIEEERR
jgi:hypothetical protein